MILIAYRCKTYLQTYMRTGHLVDYRHSNWFSPHPPHNFTYSHLIPLAGNFIPNLLSLVFIAESLRYAGLAGINQGIMTGLLALASLFNSVLFYFVFGEKLGWIHILGMAIMLAGVIFLGLESGKGGDTSSDGVQEANSDGIKAIAFGIAAPAFFTVKAYSIRKYPNYKAWDLGIDSLIFEYLCYCIMYAIWI